MWLWIESTRPVLVAAASSHVRFAGCSVAVDMSTAVGGMLLLVGASSRAVSRRLDASRAETGRNGAWRHGYIQMHVAFAIDAENRAKWRRPIAGRRA